MVLRAILTLGIIVLAAGVWWAGWTILRTNWRARREWPRMVGEITAAANQLRPTVKVERGIEIIPPIPAIDGSTPYEPDERVLDMESDEGLRWGHDRVEFLINPVTHRARVARRFTFSPFLLALLGVVYLAIAGGFYWVTSPSMQQPSVADVSHLHPALGNEPDEEDLAPDPAAWTYFQAPTWTEPAKLAAKCGTWSWLQYLLGIVISMTALVLFWTGRDSFAKRAGYGSIAIFIALVAGVYVLHKATYRIEADSTGLRESSALGWRMAPWDALRGAVQEKVTYTASRSSRSTNMTDHVTERVYFTDDHQREVVSIGDELDAQQGKDLLDYVLTKTNLKPVKRERTVRMTSYSR